MNDCIFTKEILMKSDVYAKIKALLLQAGWRNISSKQLTEHDVFVSSGESGKQALCFQLTDLYNTKSFGTTASQYLQCRLVRSYTPGTDGEAGVFERPDEPWRLLPIFNAEAQPDTMVDFYYHVNKNRIVFVVDPPGSSGLLANATMIGLSNETHIEEYGADGVMIASTNNNVANLAVIITANPGQKSTVSYALGCTPLNIPKENCQDGTRLIAKVYYGSVYEGVRGFIDGVYAVTSTHVGEGYEDTCHSDILVAADGTTKYRVFMCHTGAKSSWGYKGAAPLYRTAVAVRVQ